MVSTSHRGRYSIDNVYFKRIEANHQLDDFHHDHHDDDRDDHDENHGDRDDDDDDLVQDQQPSIVFVPDSGVANNLLC